MIERENWSEVTRGFNDHFQTDESGERLRYETGSRHFEIRRNGEFSAGMPLHSVEGWFERIEFTDSEVRLSGDEVDYVFRS